MSNGVVAWSFRLDKEGSLSDFDTKIGGGFDRFKPDIKDSIFSCVAPIPWFIFYAGEVYLS